MDGKQILESLEEIVRPEHTALVVVDMQNDFCSKKGLFATQGGDLSIIEGMVPRLRAFIEEARRRKLLIVWTMNTALPGYVSDSPAWLRLKTKGWTGKWVGKAKPQYTIQGTWGEQIVDKLRPRGGEIMVQKYRSDAFFNTNLDVMLRSNDVKSLILTGVVTHGCVEATMRHASFLDYYVVLLRDCVGALQRSLHNASLRVMEALYDVATSREVTSAWDAQSKNSRRRDH